MENIKKINDILEPVILGEEDANQGHIVKICKEIPKIFDALQTPNGVPQLQHSALMNRHNAVFGELMIKSARLKNLESWLFKYEDEIFGNNESLFRCVKCEEILVSTRCGFINEGDEISDVVRVSNMCYCEDCFDNEEEIRDYQTCQMCEEDYWEDDSDIHEYKVIQKKKGEMSFYKQDIINICCNCNNHTGCYECVKCECLIISAELSGYITSYDYCEDSAKSLPHIADKQFCLTCWNIERKNNEFKDMDDDVIKVSNYYNGEIEREWADSQVSTYYDY